MLIALPTFNNLGLIYTSMDMNAPGTLLKGGFHYSALVQTITFAHFTPFLLKTLKAPMQETETR